MKRWVENKGTMDGTHHGSWRSNWTLCHDTVCLPAPQSKYNRLDKQCKCSAGLNWTSTYIDLSMGSGGWVDDGQDISMNCNVGWLWKRDLIWCVTQMNNWMNRCNPTVLSYEERCSQSVCSSPWWCVVSSASMFQSFISWRTRTDGAESCCRGGADESFYGVIGPGSFWALKSVHAGFMLLFWPFFRKWLENACKPLE